MISYLDENFEYEITDDLKIIIIKCLTHKFSYLFLKILNINLHFIVIKIKKHILKI